MTHSLWLACTACEWAIRSGLRDSSADRKAAKHQISTGHKVRPVVTDDEPGQELPEGEAERRASLKLRALLDLQKEVHRNDPTGSTERQEEGA